MGRARGRNGTQAVALSRRGASAPAPYSIPDLKIQWDEDGCSIGLFVVGSDQKEAIDLSRNACHLGERALLFHGPAGSGKTAMTEQMAAVLQYPLVVIDEPQGETQAVRLQAGCGVPATKLGRQCTVALDSEQIRALESLGEAKLLAVRNQDPEFQAVLAEAVRADMGVLQIDIVDGATDHDDLGGFDSGVLVGVHPNTTVIFEVEGDSFEDNPCLSFEAIADTSPLVFGELTASVREQIEAETQFNGSAWAQPEAARPRGKSDDSERINEVALTVKAAVAKLEAAEPRREALIDQLQSIIGTVGDPGLLGEDGHAFIERAVSNFELQAYFGDNRADRTMRLQLQALFPHTMRYNSQDGLTLQNMALADVLPSLQLYCDILHEDGDVFREQTWGKASE